MTKKLSLFFFPALALLLTACHKDFLFDFIPKHHEAPVQTNFTEPNLFPEGLAYDPFHDWFYVSSASQGDIGIVTFNGTYKAFINDEKLTGTTGLKVDKSHKRLWVCKLENGMGAYDLNAYFLQTCRRCFPIRLFLSMMWL